MPEDEIRHRWAGLSAERRVAVMSFDDAVLVDRIKSSLQALFQKQMMMNATMSTLGMNMAGSSADPFATSTIFTQAFEFTWPASRSMQNPHLVMLEAGSLPIMAMKLDFAARPQIFEDFKALLPDLFSERSKRTPIPRARWKDLWSSEPSSVSDMERQIVKLVEQAFWTMGADHAFANSDDGMQQITNRKVQLQVAACDADCIDFEDWMMEPCLSPNAKPSGDSKKTTKKKRARGVPAGLTRQASQSPSVLHETDESSLDESELNGDQETESKEDSDENIGQGVFHIGAAHSGISAEPTAACTPTAACLKFKDFPKLPPPSPLGSNASMQPRQLVCYIWNQTSQFPNDNAEHGQTGRAADNFFRGAWLEPSQPGTPCVSAKAVVKNTFVDIDDPSERPSSMSRASRSLSPSHLHSRDESWHDHWHV